MVWVWFSDQLLRGPEQTAAACASVPEGCGWNAAELSEVIDRPVLNVNFPLYPLAAEFSELEEYRLKSKLVFLNLQVFLYIPIIENASYAANSYYSGQV